jgi:hypothetical protein
MTPIARNHAGADRWPGTISASPIGEVMARRAGRRLTVTQRSTLLRRQAMNTLFLKGARLLGICAATVFLEIPAVHGAEANVDWINQRNVTATTYTLEKTAGCNGCDDAGATSSRAIWQEGHVEFSPGEVNTFWVAGLGRSNAGTAFEDVEFGFRFNGAGRADVFENGVYKGGDTTYAAGDRFRVAVLNGRVLYLKNGELLYESQQRPQFPLLLDAALGTVGATIRHATISTEDRFDDGEGGGFSRFDALDTNRSGRLEWYEWPGDWNSFDARDLDRDGALTWGEASRIDAAGPAIERSVQVDPAQRWTDTGLWVSRGDVLTFDARGLVQLSTNPGDDAWPSGSISDRRAANAPLRQQPAGALIARIGDSAPGLVGQERRLVAPATGRLYLGVNDDHLADNSGAFDVHVAIDRR